MCHLKAATSSSAKISFTSIVLVCIKQRVNNYSNGYGCAVLFISWICNFCINMIIFTSTGKATTSILQPICFVMKFRACILLTEQHSAAAEASECLFLAVVMCSLIHVRVVLSVFLMYILSQSWQLILHKIILVYTMPCLPLTYSTDKCSCLVNTSSAYPSAHFANVSWVWFLKLKKY